MSKRKRWIVRIFFANEELGCVIESMTKKEAMAVFNDIRNMIHLKQNTVDIELKNGESYFIVNKDIRWIELERDKTNDNE